MRIVNKTLDEKVRTQNNSVIGGENPLEQMMLTSKSNKITE